jgi:hypothetical protein
MISEGARRALMVWAGSAQEDHARGETGSPSDGTFWHITSVLNTGGGSIASEDKAARPLIICQSFVGGVRRLQAAPASPRDVIDTARASKRGSA